jgi:hypothetical protein
MVVDPVTVALVVIIGTAAAQNEGSHMFDGWNGHG